MRHVQRHYSTVPLLCAFVFSALALSNEALVIGVGGFKLSIFDLLFVAILAVKLVRLTDPAAYSLPSARITLLMALNLLAWVYLVYMAPPPQGVEVGDMARDMRIVAYFLLTPYLCYKDIDGPAAYRKLQWTIVASGLTVAALMITKVAIGFSTVEPVRDVTLGIWVIPMSITSILYFREVLGLKSRTAYFLTMFLFMALVFSLNRSQYLQLGVTVGIAVVLGGKVGALRRVSFIFAPAIIGGLLVFYAIGYLDVLESRVLTVEALDDDSSYGARVQEYDGQMDQFRERPMFGHGAGYRYWVMGENGFELGTFAHNSWAFYLMKFGLIGSIVIMGPPLLLMLLSLSRRNGNAGVDMHRRYLIACVPIYIFIDSLSGGLAYAPKTALTGFLLTYCLSLLRNYRPPLSPYEAAIRAAAPAGPVTPAWPPRRDPRPIMSGQTPGKSAYPRLPHHG
ncbi:O-antigen ligase family protein [Bordetella sp. H567]|uniref:O-antigen ligase family protein n=1 Tax=Bordetella sp. H567 TaxID=1697043 RepID=UPI00082A0CF3|nr:O-antigen ligase family protein [Bordetella sp. H567]